MNTRVCVLISMMAAGALWVTTGAASAIAQTTQQAPADNQALANLPLAKLLKLAKVGDEEAQMAVGLAYETGSQGAPDLAEAARWYRQSALTGNLESQFRLARIVSKGAKGLTQDKATALKLYTAAAEKGHAQSQNALGQLYQNGDGVPKDSAKAYTWYQKAADARLAVAENNLGIMYLNGSGVSRDLGEAFKLFERAAVQGDGWGLNNLGGMYEMGWGVVKDTQKARTYYQDALAAGILSAQNNLDRLATTASTTPLAQPGN